MKSLLFVCLVMVGCSGVKSAANVGGVHNIVCAPMSDCFMQASSYCGGKFQLVVREGTKSAPTIEEWTPSLDGKFHLAVSCQ